MRTRLTALLLAVLLASPVLARPPARLPADCAVHAVAGVRLSACLKGDALTVQLGGAENALSFTRRINPEGTFDGQVTIDQIDASRLALRYADSECDVALIVDRATARVVADSGCHNSQYCAFKLPAAKSACTATLSCGDGGEGEVARKVDVCAAAPPPAVNAPVSPASPVSPVGTPPADSGRSAAPAHRPG